MSEAQIGALRRSRGLSFWAAVQAADLYRRICGEDPPAVQARGALLEAVRHHLKAYVEGCRLLSLITAEVHRDV